MFHPKGVISDKPGTDVMKWKLFSALLITRMLMNIYISVENEKRI